MVDNGYYLEQDVGVNSWAGPIITPVWRMLTGNCEEPHLWLVIIEEGQGEAASMDGLWQDVF